MIAHAEGVARLAFGSIEFCADLGCEHSRQMLLPARFELVLASRLAGIAAPIDGVAVQLDDMATSPDGGGSGPDLDVARLGILDADKGNIFLLD